MSYRKRRIDVSIALGLGDYGEGGADVLTLKGLRVSAQIHRMVAPSFCTAQIRIYGMKLDLMNRLTSLGLQRAFYLRENTISITAGDDVGGMALVYFGGIMEAWAEFGGMPDVSFAIESQTGGVRVIKPVPPASYGESVDAATVLASLAVLMGLGFENNGASAMLSNPYYPGTAIEQAQRCADAAGFGMVIDDHTLAIWPHGGNRGGAVPVVSPSTGMAGYPSYTGTGIRIRTEYNPAIRFMAPIDVETSITPAARRWVVNRLTHNLESETIGGAWFTELEGYRDGDTPTAAAR